MAMAEISLVLTCIWSFPKQKEPFSFDHSLHTDRVRSPTFSAFWRALLTLKVEHVHARLSVPRRTEVGSLEDRFFFPPGGFLFTSELNRRSTRARNVCVLAVIVDLDRHIDGLEVHPLGIAAVPQHIVVDR